VRLWEKSAWRVIFIAKYVDRFIFYQGGVLVKEKQATSIVTKSEGSFNSVSFSRDGG
jgi:hypothetical protein